MKINTPAKKPQKAQGALRFLVLLIAVFLLWFIGRNFSVEGKALEGVLGKLPLGISALLYIAFYVLVTFFIWFSKDVFRLAAAIVFGPYISTLFIWVAEAINAFVLFHLARALGRDFVESKMRRRYSYLDDRLGKISFFWLFIFRAAPLIPFRFMDLASGVTDISFRRYFLAVVLGSPLRIFWLQYVLAGVGAALLKDPLIAAEFIAQNKFLSVLSFCYILLVIVLAVKFRQKDK